MSDQPTLRRDDELIYRYVAGAENRPPVNQRYIERQWKQTTLGFFVPVEPVGALTVSVDLDARWGTYSPETLPPGEYLIVPKL